MRLGLIWVSAERTDSGGLVSFNVSNGAYKFRVDYLGYQFWTEIYSVPSSLSGTLTIPHQDVTVSGMVLNQGSPYPMEGVSVYLFTASGLSLGPIPSDKRQRGSDIQPPLRALTRFGPIILPAVLVRTIHVAG